MQKLSLINDHLIRYMETERILIRNLNHLKEQNNTILNEYATKQKEQASVNENISNLVEEIRKVNY
jgi:hypothetical protein